MPQAARKIKRETQDINNNNSYTTSQTHSASTMYFSTTNNTTPMNNSIKKRAGENFSPLYAIIKHNINKNKEFIMPQTARKRKRTETFQTENGTSSTTQGAYASYSYRSGQEA